MSVLKFPVKCAGSTLLAGALLVTPVPAHAACGYWKACVRCMHGAITSAWQASTVAFNTLDASIVNLGAVFSAGTAATGAALTLEGARLSAYLGAASNSIQLTERLRSRAATDMLDQLNLQDEARLRQRYALDRRRQLDENYGAESIPDNVKSLYASQAEVSVLDQVAFQAEYTPVVTKLLQAPRDRPANVYSAMLPPERADVSDEVTAKVWSGEIEGAEQALAVADVTQQMLMGMDLNPYEDLVDPSALAASGEQDERLLVAENTKIRARMKPVLDFFSFDQGLRTQPEVGVPSAWQWISDQVDRGMQAQDAFADLAVNSSEKELYAALATEIRTQNLLRVWSWNVDQMRTRMQGAAFGQDQDQQRVMLRTLIKTQTGTNPAPGVGTTQ